jgi:transcriptional regulator with XRE-family HTH domain
MTFGEHIRQWREEHRVGLRRFARAAGVSPTFVSKMERGLGPLPGEETIRTMANILGQDPDVLLAMADKEYRKSKATFHVAPAPPSTPEYAFFESLRQREEALLKKHSPQ